MTDPAAVPATPTAARGVTGTETVSDETVELRLEVAQRQLVAIGRG